MASLDDDRRDRVLKAAVAVFARYGYRRTSMEALAQAAEMSRPALYQYFRNKDAVFREMTRWALDRNARAAEAAAEAAAGPQEAVQEILRIVLALHLPGRDASHLYELIDEVQSRTGDLWSHYEKRLLAALRARLAQVGAGAGDAAEVLFYGTKGIGLAPHTAAQRRALVRRLAATVLRGVQTG